MQAVAAQSSSVLGGIGRTIREMDSMVEGIAAAVDGGATSGGAGGLAQLAEVLRAEVLRLVEAMRAG